VYPTFGVHICYIVALIISQYKSHKLIVTDISHILSSIFVLWELVLVQCHQAIFLNFKKTVSP